MHAEAVIASIVRRTGIPHDEVRLVFEVARDIIKEQLGVYESVVVPEICRIKPKQTPKSKHWQVVAFVFREVEAAIGSGIIPLNEGTETPPEADPF